MSAAQRDPERREPNAASGSALDVSDSSPPVAGRTFCGLRLQPAISHGNVIAFMSGTFLMIGLAVGTAVLQPYLLSTFLHLDPARQGQVAGMAASVGGFAGLLASPIIGVASGWLGRRAVFAGGFVLVGVIFILLPFSTSVLAMVSLTTLGKLGNKMSSLAGMAIMGDYFAYESRGQGNGLIGLVAGLASATLGSLVGKLPGLVSGAPWATADGKGEGYFTYWLLALCLLLTAAMMCACLAPREMQASQVSKNFSSLERLREDILAIMDPGIVLACLTCLLAQGDLQVASVFIPQWCVSFALQQTADEFGLSPDQLTEEQTAAVTQIGLRRGSTYVGLLGLAVVVGSPIFGRLFDSMDRVAVLLCSALLTATGWVMFGMSGDPFGAIIYGACLLVGFGAAGLFVSVASFVQQQAPPKSLGTAIGIFSMCGSIGTILHDGIGGQLFSRWRMEGPFWLMAGGNIAVVLLGMAMYRFIKPPPGEEEKKNT